MNLFVKSSLALCAVLCASSCWATTVSEAETAAAARWCDRYVRGTTAAEPTGLVVVRNNDPVIRNEMPGGRGPLKVGGKDYNRGLNCHADSKVIVKVGKKCKRFESVAGIDDRNHDLSSIVLSVEANDKELYNSGLLRHDTKTFVDVNVDLGGATEFAILAGDGGDNISFDWADWADARVTCEDGSVVWLGDMDFIGSWDSGKYFFSFDYDGKSSDTFLDKWIAKRFSKTLKDGSVQHFVKYIDPATKLTAEAEFVEYKDFPTVEWRMKFTNNGTSNTPLITNIRPLSRVITGGSATDPYVMRHMGGSASGPADYKPLTTPLVPGAKVDIANTNGRPTETHAPYFNIDMGNKSGIILALGWQGQWTASFLRSNQNTLEISAGQEKMNISLKPGETITTPRVVLQFWSGGDWIRAQNIWRRWMVAHNSPKPGGKSPKPTLEGCSSACYAEMQLTDTGKQKMFIDRYLEEKIPIDYWWMDAGWYTYFDQWFNTGTWVVDTKRFPNGLGEISDYAHKKGVKTLLWFETECVTPDTEIANEHPEWVFRGDVCRNFKPGDPRPWLLLDLGNPKAKEWVQTRILKILNENKIDLYRQDFRMDPVGYWREADIPNREGMHEIRHCENYRDMWNAISKARPNDFIDSCAAGGRRNEIDAMKLGIPLWRSDYAHEPVGCQSQTYGIAFWLPYFGTGVAAEDAYGFRSVMCPMMNALYDMRNRDLNYDAIRKYVGQWKKAAPYMLCDYYPLTEYSMDTDCWIGWQFDSPEKGGGMVEMFRRCDSPFKAGTFKLRGLDPDARYIITDEDTGKQRVAHGKELLEKGIEINLPTPNTCVLFTYLKL